MTRLNFNRNFRRPLKKSFSTIKGVTYNLWCHDMHYEPNKWYRKNGKLEFCKRGYHSINPDNNPLNVFNYYPPVAQDMTLNRYFKARVKNVVDADASKVLSCKIKLEEELSIEDILELHSAWLERKSVLSHLRTDDYWKFQQIPTHSKFIGKNSYIATVGHNSLISVGSESVIAAARHCSLNVHTYSTLSVADGCLVMANKHATIAAGDRCMIEAYDNAKIVAQDACKIVAARDCSIVAGQNSYIKIIRGVAVADYQGVSIVTHNGVAISFCGAVKIGADCIGIVVGGKPYFYGAYGSRFIYIPTILRYPGTCAITASGKKPLIATVGDDGLEAETWYTVVEGKFARVANSSVLDSID